MYRKSCLFIFLKICIRSFSAHPIHPGFHIITYGLQWINTNLYLYLVTYTTILMFVGETGANWQILTLIIAYYS